VVTVIAPPPAQAQPAPDAASPGPSSGSRGDRGRPALTIHEFPSTERPRERLRAYGAGNLSNSELIAILLRTGLEGENVVSLATRVLASVGGLSGFARVNYDELCAEKGVSDAKACQLLAALELGRRAAALTPEDRPAGGTPADIVRLLLPEMSAFDREHFRVVLLNARNEVVGVEELYAGSVNTALVRPAEVFAAAVRRNCMSIAVVHNHPSGDPAPSEEDVAITRRLIDAGKFLDVELVDHIIIGQGRYFSMKEKGLGFR
jgi:DNA repair protein RadC